MRQLCADAEDAALVWQNEHRHAVKTTESGHKRSSTHGGKENLVAHHDLSLWSFQNPRTFRPSNLIGRISIISIHWVTNIQSSLGNKHSCKHTGEMSLRHILRGWWQTFSWSTTQNEEEDVQYRSWEERGGWGSHTYIQMPLRGQNSTTGQRFATDYGLLPHPPLTFINIFYPIVFLLFFSTPEKYNCLISGSNKSTINNANKIKISVRHKESITNLTVLRVSQQGLMGSAVHGTYRRGQMCATSTGNKMFPRVTTAALFPFM